MHIGSFKLNPINTTCLFRYYDFVLSFMCHKFKELVILKKPLNIQIELEIIYILFE